MLLANVVPHMQGRASIQVHKRVAATIEDSGAPASASLGAMRHGQLAG